MNERGKETDRLLGGGPLGDCGRLLGASLGRPVRSRDFRELLRASRAPWGLFGMSVGFLAASGASWRPLGRYWGGLREMFGVSSFREPHPAKYQLPPCG